MKRMLAILLALVMVLGLFGCTTTPTETSKPQDEVTEPTVQTTVPVETTEAKKEPEYVVSNPMERPDYSFPEGYTPTIDEMRERAVQAMHDMLSIQWCTEEFVTYRKTGAVSDKVYRHAPGNTFCGLPYADHNGSIFSFLEYYDYETGILNVGGDGDNFNKSVGNTCTGSVMWAWSAVCDSLAGPYVNYNMVKFHGVYPIGDYTYPMITSYQQYSTQKICEDNGKDVILAGYALCLPADGLTSSPDDHGMMVVEPAHVEYLPDGSIDADNSYLIIQDQRAGQGSVFYEIEEDGEIHHYSGRTYHKMTFNQLYQKWYIPCRPAEFMGEDPYAQAEVKLSGETPADLSALLKLKVQSNYPMAVLRFTVTDQNGVEHLVYRDTFGRNEVSNGTARNYQLNFASSSVKAGLEEAGVSGTMRLTAVISTGAEIVLAEFPVTPAG